MPKLPKPRPTRRTRKGKNKGLRLPKTNTEPAFARGVGIAVLTLLAGLGFDWAADVDVSWAPFIGIAVIAVAQGIWTRFAVTANAKVVTRVDDGRVVAGDAAVVPAGTQVDVVSHRARPFPMVSPVAVRPDAVRPIRLED